MRHPVIAVAAALTLTAATPRAGVSAPPTPILDQAEAIGPMLLSPAGPLQVVTISLFDRDTVPAGARLEFRWHAEPAAAVAGYRYKLREPTFVEVDSSVHGVAYPGTDTLPRASGISEFTLQAFDHDGNVGEVRRVFAHGFSPVTWVAGPDLALLDARFGWTGPPRSLAIADWSALPDLSGTPLSCDSLTVRPLDRPARLTFFEIYGDRIYVRSDGDTVHMNSWVLAHGGGFDADSPYLPVVAPGSPALLDTVDCAPAGPPLVVRSAGIVGSPIGLRLLLQVVLEPTTIIANTNLSQMFPYFDVGDVLYRPVIGGYVPNRLTGRAYLTLRAQDADGSRDNRVEDPRPIVAAVESGTATPEQIEMRKSILTYYVNRPPFLLLDHPDFVPRPRQKFTSRTLALHLPADDLDPFESGSAPGGPSTTRTLRWNVTLLGRTPWGRDTTIAALPSPVFTPEVTIEVPDVLAHPDVTIRVEICDCAACEDNPGSGRCVIHDTPIMVPAVPFLGVDRPAPARLRLDGMFPNPSSAGRGIVRFSLAGSGPARLELVDISGRLVARHELRSLGPGPHEVRLDPGDRLPAGVYVLRLIEGRESRTVRAAVMR